MHAVVVPTICAVPLGLLLATAIAWPLLGLSMLLYPRAESPFFPRSYGVAPPEKGWG